MNALKFLASLLLGLVIFGSAFGALASLEPSDTGPIHTAWLVAYSIIGLTAVASIVLLWSPSPRRGHESNNKSTPSTNS